MRAPIEHRFAGPTGELCWFEWGERGSAPTVLMLHATGFHARVWDQTIVHLPKATHVISVDFRGHGRSYKPASLGDWGATADDILPLIDHLALRNIIGVGHSMGGNAMARIAAQRPDVFARLVLVDPTIFEPDHYVGGADRPETDPAAHPVARRRSSWADAKDMAAHLARKLPYSAFDSRVLADYCAHGSVPVPDGSGVTLACPPMLEASVYLGNARTNPHPLLASIACPVTVLRAKTGERGGALDFSISPTWSDLAAALPDARDMQWSEHSHFIPMEAPARLAALIAAELVLASPVP